MFSNLTHNAINALLLVAQQQMHGPVTTEFISHKLGLSISYLESLMSQLKKHGFVVSYRGPGGGYCTLGQPAELKVLDLIHAFEPQTSHTSTDNPGELDKNIVSDLVHSFVENHFQGVSFEDLLVQLPEDQLGLATKPMAKQDGKQGFKPLKIHKLPTGPNSVFNLAQSMVA